MCGRYFFNENINLKKYQEILNRKWDQPSLDLWKTGEIFPGNIVLALSDEDYTLMKWGYQLFNRNMINSRIESLEKYYKVDYKIHKCVLPANGFYEWNQGKDKFYIHCDEPIVYLAGLYQNSSSFNQFSIITKEADQTRYIHHRVPIVLNEKEALQYLHNELKNDELIMKKPPLIAEAQNENLTLF